MAGSRAHRLGSLFSRVNGLLENGAMKPQDKPVWYEVYAAFPPSVEPKYSRFSLDLTPRDIIYKEDGVRAYFYQTYGNCGVFDMRNDVKSTSQLFIDAYREVGGSFDALDELRLSEAAEILKKQGLKLKTQQEVDQEKLDKLRKLEEKKNEIATETPSSS